MRVNRRLLSLVSTAGVALAMTGLTSTSAMAQPDGSIGVNSTTNSVHGSGFGTDVTVTITDGGTTETFSGDQIESDGSGGFQLYAGFDIHAGQTVAAHGSDASATMTVSNVGITGWNFAANTVTGVATDQASPNAIFVSLAHYPNSGEWSSINAWQTGGSWTTDDLTNAGPPFTLRPGDTIEACQPDPNDNESCVTRIAGEPRFAFGTELQEVVGLGWTPGQQVTLTIDRPPLGGPPEFSATTTPPSQSEPYSGWLQLGQGGTVYFDLTQGSFQARAGDVMQMTQGSTAKTLIVPALTTDLPDFDTGTVSGHISGAEPGGFLSVADGAFASCGGGFVTEVTPDTGAWAYTFGPGGIGGCGTPVAYQTDPDGDVAESHAPMPAVYADPQADRIWAIDFAPGNVTLTVTRSGATPHVQTVATTNVLTRGSWNLDMWATPVGSLPRPAVGLFDLSGGYGVQPGDVVSVTDTAGTTRSFVVANLSVDSVSATTDTVTGTASQTLALHLGDGEGGYWGYSVAPVLGAWSFTFTAGEFPNPPDGLTPGMVGQAIVNADQGATVVRWTVPPVTTPTEPSQLASEVQALGLGKTGDRLLDVLAKAQADYDRGKAKQGTKTMNDFIKKVHKLMPPISPADGARLISDAQAVIAAHS